MVEQRALERDWPHHLDLQISKTLIDFEYIDKVAIHKMKI